MRRNRATNRVDRRSVLETLGAVAVGASGFAVGGSRVAAASGSFAGESFVRVGVNTFDNDDGGADVRIVRASDPDGGGRVARATSGGNRTTDYATSILDVPNVALGDLSRLSYEYYGGARNAMSAPDEVWALLEAGGDRYAVFRHANDSDPNAQTWRTRNVLAEIRGNSSLSPGRSWATLVEKSGEVRVASLKPSLVETFGRNAILRRVGAGRGRTGDGGTVADLYLRNIRLNGDRVGGFPASGARRLPKLLVVSSPGTDELLNYTFEVTGDLENLEPDEDSGPATEEITQVGDRVRVRGAVSTGDDRFAFSGNLVEVDVPAAVQLDVRSR